MKLNTIFQTRREKVLDARKIMGEYATRYKDLPTGEAWNDAHSELEIWFTSKMLTYPEGLLERECLISFDIGFSEGVSAAYHEIEKRGPPKAEKAV